VTAHHVLDPAAPADLYPELDFLLSEDCPTLIPLPFAHLAQQEVALAYPAPMGSNWEDILMQSQMTKTQSQKVEIKG
jgi:hypothetical protein